MVDELLHMVLIMELVLVEDGEALHQIFALMADMLSRGAVPIAMVLAEDAILKIVLTFRFF